MRLRRYWNFTLRAATSSELANSCCALAEIDPDPEPDLLFESGLVGLPEELAFICWSPLLRVLLPLAFPNWLSS